MKALLISLMLISMAFGQVVDRIVAAVNDRVVTQSEWELQARFEALLEGRDPTNIQPGEGTLDRLINQALIHDNLQSLKAEGVSKEEIDQQAAAIRNQLNANADSQWLALLKRYGLTPEEFESRLEHQASTLRLVELRFRPNVQVSDRRVEQYYMNRFVPQLQMKGTPADKIPPLKDVEDQIRRIIVEERMNNVMQTWLESVRSQAKIRKLVAVQSAPQK
jgi:parvulin-like peptidyl-prolyl isomerase